jgi:hypothetical protein
MKRPRVEDFDPTAAAKLKSPMDELPQIRRPKRVKGSAEAVRTSLAQEEKSRPEDIRTPVRPSVRTEQRTLTRMPFEIYRDQHASLKQFSLEEQSRGEKGSMSQMVREALDEYISKRRAGGGD